MAGHKSKKHNNHHSRTQHVRRNRRQNAIAHYDACDEPGFPQLQRSQTEPKRRYFAVAIMTLLVLACSALITMAMASYFFNMSFRILTIVTDMSMAAAQYTLSLPLLVFGWIRVVLTAAWTSTGTLLRSNPYLASIPFILLRNYPCCLGLWIVFCSLLFCTDVVIPHTPAVLAKLPWGWILFVVGGAFRYSRLTHTVFRAIRFVIFGIFRAMRACFRFVFHLGRLLPFRKKAAPITCDLCMNDIVATINPLFTFKAPAAATAASSATAARKADDEKTVEGVVPLRSQVQQLQPITSEPTALVSAPVALTPSEKHVAHKYCRNCVISQIRAEMDRGHVMAVRCPGFAECQCQLSDEEIRAALEARNAQELHRFQQLVIHKTLQAMPDAALCPCCNYGFLLPLELVPAARNPLHPYWVGGDKSYERAFANSKGHDRRRWRCPKCTNHFCVACMTPWTFGYPAVDHTRKTCEERKLLVGNQCQQSNKWIEANTKTCPTCGLAIEKNGGCSHMRCLACTSSFCWECGVNLNDHPNHSCHTVRVKNGFKWPAPRAAHIAEARLQVLRDQNASQQQRVRMRAAENVVLLPERQEDPRSCHSVCIVQ